MAIKVDLIKKIINVIFSEKNTNLQDIEQTPFYSYE